MNQLVNELLLQANAEDKNEQEEAVLQIAMLLEKQSFSDRIDFYKTVLPYHLLSIKLDLDEQQELILGLSKLISSPKRTSSMLWALGKAKAGIGLIPLLKFLHDYSNNLDEETTWQALVALENLIAPRSMDLQMRDYLIHDDITRSWVQSLIDTRGSRNSEIAQRLQKKIERLVNNL